MKAPKQTDASAVVVPFGKHKGATVAELLAKDPQYADWVMAQGWVAERFAELHAAIATRGAGTDDTPEHNALQARFLEKPFRDALLRITRKTALCKHHESLLQWFAGDDLGRITHLENRREFLLGSIPNLTAEAAALSSGEYDKLPFMMIYEHSSKPALDPQKVARVAEFITAKTKEIQEESRRLTEYEEEVTALRASVTAILAKRLPLRSSVEFEARGVDAVITWGHEHPSNNQCPLKGGAVSVELKPAMGDDYPSVMRQMKRLESSVCVVGQYTGRGVSETQLREMFAASGLVLVFVQEIEEEVARNK